MEFLTSASLAGLVGAHHIDLKRMGQDFRQIDLFQHLFEKMQYAK